eukprot:Skav204075  [mRNA]  locus=scaffold3129:33249:35630:+ [translate_table: standard]
MREPSVLCRRSSSAVDFDLTMLGTLAKSVEASRAAWENAEGVASDTHACVATWHQRLQGAVRGWLNDLLEHSREILQKVMLLTAGSARQDACLNLRLILKDVDGARGACYKNVIETMWKLAESLPESDKLIYVKDFCEVAQKEVRDCVQQLALTASTYCTQIAMASGDSSWKRQQIQKYSDDLCLRFETLLREFLADTPSNRTTLQLCSAKISGG